MGRGWFSGPGLGVLDTRYVNVTGDTMTGALEVQANIRIRSNNELRFYDNGNFVGFEAPALAADQIWVLPAVDGAAGEALATDGGGALSWGADHGLLTGLGDDDHSQYIFNAPLTSARNVITPTLGTVIPFSIELDAAQSEDAWQIRSSGGADILSGADERGVPFCNLGTGVSNLYIGPDAGNIAGTGLFNAGIGNAVLALNTTGQQNFAFGSSALAENRNGNFNCAMGQNALSHNVSGNSNTGVGVQALRFSVSGGNNIAIGVSSAHYTLTGNNNVVIGHQAGFGVLANSYSNNTIMGFEAGFSLSTGSGHVFIGYQAARTQEVAGSNTLYIANFDTATPLIYGEFDTPLLRIHGAFFVAQQATTGGPDPSFTVTAPAHTALTASTERHEVHLNLSATQQWATGALATQRFVRIQAPTVAFVGASTLTDAITLEIGGAPIAGANATITRPAAFVVASGNVVFGAASVAKTLLTVDGHISLTSNSEIRLYDNGNYVGFEAPALTGDQIWVLPDADGSDGDVMFTDGSGNLKWGANASTRAFTFSSPSGGSGTIYAAGHYRFGASDNDFNPSISFGTTGAAYGDHIFIVAAAGASGGTDTVIRVTGTSVTDAGVRTAADTEDLTADDAGAAGAYYETTLKWIGQVTIEKISGPDLLCNYGGVKYWDDNNEDFKVEGVEATWLGGANDADPNILLRHHKATGWTYNIGSTPTPPAAIATMNTDYAPEIEVINGEEGAWKRTNLSTNIEGSGSEGVIIEITTTANKAFEIGNFLIRVVPQ